MYWKHGEIREQGHLAAPYKQEDNGPSRHCNYKTHTQKKNRKQKTFYEKFSSFPTHFTAFTLQTHLRPLKPSKLLWWWREGGGIVHANKLYRVIPGPLKQISSFLYAIYLQSTGLVLQLRQVYELHQTQNSFLSNCSHKQSHFKKTGKADSWDTESNIHSRKL